MAFNTSTVRSRWKLLVISSSKQVRGYRLKLSTVALVVFLAFAVLAFYLRNTGIIGDIEYLLSLGGLITAAIIVTVILGKFAKKRYASSAS